MKKLTCILVLLTVIACALDALAQGLFFRRSIPATGCLTTDTVLPHDILLEGWQSGGENTWTNTGDTAKIDIIDSSAFATGKPAFLCNSALVCSNGTDGVEAFKLYDLGSTIDTSSTALDVTQWIYVHTAPGNNDLIRIWGMNNSVSSATSSEVCGLNLTNAAGVVWIGIAATTTYTNIPTGEWVKVAVHLDPTAASSTFTVNDGDSQTFTRANNSVRYLRIGAPSSLDANDTGIMLFDGLHLNTP